MYLQYDAKWILIQTFMDIISILKIERNVKFHKIQLSRFQ